MKNVEKTEDRRTYYSTHKKERKIYAKKYRLAHKENVNTYSRKYNLEHKDELKDYVKKYYLENKNTIKEINRKHYWENKEQHQNYSKKYYLENKEKLDVKSLTYYKTPPGKTSMAKSQAKRNRELGYKPLNACFEGSEGHHISREYVIYIPSELHKNIRHSLLCNRNMKEINAAALDYLFTIATI